MDIYFCDLCGVRVSDADLRTGQGQRSRYDVICASCLEQGLGKEWLGKRTSARRAAVGGGADAADRVATIDDEAGAPLALAAAEPEPEPERDPGSEAAAPAGSVKDLPPAPPGLGLVDDLPPAPPGLALADDDAGDDHAPSPSLDDVDRDHDAATVEASGDTAKVSSAAQQNQLALAASAFSALGKTDRADDEEDDDLVDRAYSTPAEQLSPALGTPALAEGQSPFASGLAHAEKDETSLVPALPGTDEADLELDEPKAEKKPGTSTSSRRKSASAKGTSSRITKSAGNGGGKGKSSRNRARGKDNSRAILMYSLISLGVILLVFGAVMATKSVGRGTGSGTGTSVVDDKVISKVLSEVERQSVEALRSNDLTQLRAARDALKAAQQKVYQFEDDMVKQGNSPEQVEGVLRRLNAADRFMHIRTINDAIFKLEQQGK